MSSIKCNHLKIDSAKSPSFYNDFKTSFLFQLSEQITCQNGESILYSLVSATIPYTFYGLNRWNDSLDVQETYNGVTQPTKTIHIPHGNYDAYSFAKKLTQLMNNQNMEYAITYNKISNKFVINTVKTNTTSLFMFATGPNKDISCHQFLGLPKTGDIEINNIPLETGMITMNDIYHLQIKSDLGNQNIITSDSIDNILEIIPITPSPLSFIYYSPHVPTKYLLSQSNLQSIKIELTDNFNRPIDLNGIPFVINIKVEIVKNNDYDIPIGFDPRQLNLDNNPAEQTALERIYQNPGIIDRPSHYSTKEYMEYEIINRMLHELKNKNKKVKQKNLST